MKQVSFVFFVLLLCSLAFAQTQTPSPAAPAPATADPCSYQGEQTFDIQWTPNDILGQAMGVNAHERLAIICDMKRNFQDKYVSYSMKKELINADLDSVFNQCATRELQINDDSRLHFHDRVLLCLANLHDTHVGGTLKNQSPFVTTLFDIRQIQGHALITMINTKLVARLKADNPMIPDDFDKVVAVGNEVLAVDGVATLQAAQNLSQYINASSPAYALSSGFDSLTIRDFNYPTSPMVTFKIKLNDGTIRTLALPWWYQSLGPDAEAEEYFKNLGIHSINELAWIYNATTQKYEKVADTYGVVGYHPAKSLFPVTGLTTYLSESGWPALRFGIIDKETAKAFCYVQLRSFSYTKMKQESDKDYIGFTDAMSLAVKACKTANVPMLFDLRANPGGMGGYPDYVMSLFARTGESTLGSITTLRATRHSAQLLNQVFGGDQIPFGDLDDRSPLSVTGLEAFKQAMRLKKSYMDWVYTGDIDVDSGIGGYNGKIVAMITPDCVSSCDKMSRFLKNSQRAVLLGTAANGTGAGFFSSDKAAPDFEDAYGILKFEIPNHFFAIAPSKMTDATYDFDSHHDWLMENRPTQADVQYEPTANDVTNNNVDLIAKARELLFQ